MFYMSIINIINILLFQKDSNCKSFSKEMLFNDEFLSLFISFFLSPYLSPFLHLAIHLFAYLPTFHDFKSLRKSTGCVFCALLLLAFESFTFLG